MKTTAKSCVLLGLFVLTACTGCLREPFHGKTFESRNEAISFIGFWPKLDDRVDIEVRNPDTNDWEYLTHTYTDYGNFKDGPVKVKTGNWHYFLAEAKIPNAYWSKTKMGDYACDVRALSKNGAMQTFNASFNATAELSQNGPIAELMADYHHGQELTIYAKK